ncbi:MAG: family 43 glycosylhydrolase [Brevinema sp.]
MPSTNPIFRGFNPDPCIIRGEKAWYIATSTFEYTPGVLIYESTDLKQWELLGGALEKSSQLNLQGVSPSGGVWAPGLSYADGLYWLVFTNVKDSFGNRFTPFLEAHNYLVTTDDPRKGWSEPIYLCGRGFDPDLFHDDDGRKWVLSINWNPRGADQKDYTNGIIMQEFDPIAQKCVGKVYQIFENSGISINSEGPHLYKKDGFYYLVVAEGGTDWGHMVCVARSKNILGPYESSPKNPLITSVNDKNQSIQKAGHASFAYDDNEGWIMAYLCSRPLPGARFCPLGRETAIQKLSWVDGWPVALDAEGAITQHPSPPPAGTKVLEEDSRLLDFKKETKLAPYWSGVRTYIDGSWHRFDEGLVITGQGSPTSLFAKSEIVRRITEFNFRVETALEFTSPSFQSSAGLIVRYDESQFYFLGITHNVYGEPILRLLIREQESLDRKKQAMSYQTRFIDIPFEDTSVQLRCTCQDDFMIQFSYRTETQLNWVDIPETFPLYKLSDDYVYPLGFTGSFIGMAVHDITGARPEARFLSFQYNTF